MSTEIIKLENITAGYGKNVVLRNVNLLFEQGSLIVLGPNGAGKTTFINVLLGFLKPLSGKCFVFGRKCEENLINGFNDLVSATEKPNIIRGSILDFLEYISMYRNCDWDEFYDNIERFNLKPAFAKRKFKDLSAGERMKLYLSAILSIESKLYILDEPNSNLDVESRRVLGNILLDKLKENKNLILTTHIYEYINEIATHVMILNRGEIVLYGRVEDIMRKYMEDTCMITVKPSSINKFISEITNLGIKYKRLENNLFLIHDCSKIKGIKDLDDLVISINFATIEVLYKTILGMSHESK